MPRCARPQLQGRSFRRRRSRSENRLDLRSREDQRRDETATENAGPCVPQRHRRLGKSNHRKNGRMVLEKLGTSMSWPLRDRGSRNCNCALRVSRRITAKDGLGSVRSKHDGREAVTPVPRVLLQLDRVALHLVIEGGALDAEKFGCLFLVAAALCKCLEDGSTLDVVESLYAAARHRGELRLLQRRGQLDFSGELFYADHALAREHHCVFNCVLQFANISRP